MKNRCQPANNHPLPCQGVTFSGIRAHLIVDRFKITIGDLQPPAGRPHHHRKSDRTTTVAMLGCNARLGPGLSAPLVVHAAAVRAAKVTPQRLRDGPGHAHHGPELHERCRSPARVVPPRKHVRSAPWALRQHHGHSGAAVRTPFGPGQGVAHTPGTPRARLPSTARAAQVQSPPVRTGKRPVQKPIQCTVQTGKHAS